MPRNLSSELEAGFTTIPANAQEDTPKKTNRPRIPFAARLEALVAFKEQHGHCDVPSRYPENPALGEWVKNVRRGRQKVQDDQRRLLSAVGFNWETRDDRFQREWLESLEKLKQYRLTHGDCLVPWKYEPDQQLAEWVHTQRKLNNKNQLRNDRKEALDAVGFVWDPRSERSSIAKEESRLEEFGVQVFRNFGLL